MPTDRHPAIYLRVSSQSQDVRSQEPELKRWAAAQDGPAAVWYRDKATGTNMQRPGWEQLWADVLTGQVSRIVCPGYDVQKVEAAVRRAGIRNPSVDNMGCEMVVYWPNVKAD